jgi:hypothetical protein
MQVIVSLRTGAIFAGVTVLLGLSAYGQDGRPTVAPGQGSVVRVAKGIPPRANPGEYLAHAQVGTVTIAAEFDRHSVPMPEQILSTEDYVAVEVGMFGPPDARLKISAEDFSLRINGKKSALPVEQFTAVFKSLRDPEYNPPEIAEAKASKSNGINTGGNGQQSDLGSTPPPIHIPPAMERAMSEHVQAAALPEGDRALPVAGLIFFRYGGSDKGVHSVELVYTGPAGKATIPMQP